MTAPLTVLSAPQWQPLAAAHHDRVQQLTAGHRGRAGRAQGHPVEDFLFTYYSLRPQQLARWHPGLGVGLLTAPDRAQWPLHIVTDGGAVTVDVPAFIHARGSVLPFVRRLLANTATAPAQFGCFGLHEWAMVHRQSPDEIRHSAWPLRLGSAGTDEVVTSHQIRCSHYDAYRFFTPAARPLNLLSPDLASREAMEQPGCLHATMDLYKWAYKLVPAVSTALLMRCFRLAREVRELDMRASPYDLAAIGFPPVTIETAAGKAEYVAAQRDFASRGQILRTELLSAVDQILAVGAAPVSAAG